MSTSSTHRTPKTGGKSVFFNDLASPASTTRAKFSTPGQAAAVSALWRENFGCADPPPPPMFTLEDRADCSPESGFSDYQMKTQTQMRTPVRWELSSSAVKSRFEANLSSGQHQMQQSNVGLSWWSPRKSENEEKEKEKGSPVEGMVKPGALITLPPPREVARPELPRNSLPTGSLDEEEWVTVYGFSPRDTNYVLHEFEKCGVILKHVPGPGNANWMHLLYQNRSDARKALGKSGTEINGILIVGVKPVDPSQRQALNEGVNNQGFMTFPPPQPNRNMELLLPSRASSQPLQTSQTAQRSSVGVIATPAKSMVSKIADLMFGI